MNAHRVRLEPSALSVDPGKEASCTVHIWNTGDVVDAFDVQVLGPAAAWTAVEPAAVSLFPGAEGTVRLTFRPPRAADVPAGPMPFAVRVQSRDAGLATSVVEEGSIDVAAFVDVAAELVPRTSHGRLIGRHRVQVTNRANAPAAVRLSGSDSEQAVELAFAPPVLLVQAGGTAGAGVKARCRTVSWTAPARQWAFQVTAEAEGAAPVQMQGAMEQLPLLGKWTRRAVAVGTIALVAVAAYAVKGPAIRSAASAALGLNRAGSPTSGPQNGGSLPASAPNGGTSPTAMPSGGASHSVSPSAGTHGGTTGSSPPNPPAPPAPAAVIASSSVAPGSFNSVRVMCPSGTQAISGGIDPGNVLTVVVTSSAPVYADNNNRLIFRADGPNPAAVGWQVSARNNDTTAQTIRAAVVCAGAYAGSTSTVVATSNLFGGGNFGVTSVACPSGSVALGGGVDLDNVLTMAATSSGPTYRGTRLLATAAGRNPAPDGWQGSARNDSSTSMKFKVAVICSTAAAGRTSSVVSSPSFIPSGTFAANRVLCPSGAATVGGGVDTGNVLRTTVTSSAPVFPGANARTLSRSDGPDQAPVGWQASARNDDATAEPVTAAVICTTP